MGYKLEKKPSLSADRDGFFVIGCLLWHLLVLFFEMSFYTIHKKCPLFYAIVQKDKNKKKCLAFL